MRLSLSTTLLLVLWNHAGAAPEGQLQIDDAVQMEIVGGQQSDPGEFPYFVDMFWCGGSLIAPRVVLSAAHCGSFFGYGGIVGGYEVGTENHGAEWHDIVKEAFHPEYNHITRAWDFSLHLLDEEVAIPGPVKLDLNQDKAKPAHDQQLTVMGLGLTDVTGSSTKFLQDVEVNTVANGLCEDLYLGQVDKSVMICATAPGKDTCAGDSGGPIVIRDGDTHTQVGVVSWGEGCADPQYPGVYSRVSAGMPWIKDVVCNQWGEKADFCDGDGTDPDDDPDACIDVVVDLKTDKFPKQTKVMLVTETGEKIWKKNRLRKKKTNHHFEVCVKKSGCATLKVLDRKKNGLTSPGNLKVTADGKVKYNGRKYGAGRTFKFGDGC